MQNEPDGLAMRTYPGGVRWTRAEDGSYNLRWGALGAGGSGATDAGAIARRIHTRNGHGRDRVVARLTCLGWRDVLAHLLAIEFDLAEGARARRIAEVGKFVRLHGAKDAAALQAIDQAQQLGLDLRARVAQALGTPEEPEDGDCRFPWGGSS